MRDRSTVVRPTPIEHLDLTSKTIAVIGGTNGIGRALAQRALARGAQVTVVGRTLRDNNSPRLTFVATDLSSMREAARVGAQLPAEDYDVVVFTTGIIAAKKREQTGEGIERDLAVSYLNRLAILQQISHRLGTARPSSAPRVRVFVMGSPGNGMLGQPDDLNGLTNYSAMKVHGNTIAGNEMLALGANGRFPGPAFFGLRAGMVKTGIRSNILGEGSLTHRVFETAVGILGQSADSYAKRMVPILFAADLEGKSSVLFSEKARPILPSRGLDEDHTERFMLAAESILKRALD
jgi:hypothetical protein